MNGLRQYQRDFEWLAAAGEAELCPPSMEQFLEWIGEHLTSPGQSAPSSAQWTYARWKPGHSVTAMATVTLDDGSQHLVSCKRFGADQAKATPARPRWHPDDGPLRPAAQVPGANVILSTLPGDRSLDGLSQVLRPGHLARLVEGSGIFAEHTLKARSSQADLLRYKPERRAIYSYLADLHRPAPKPRRRSLLVRVLPPQHAAASAHARSLLQSLAGDDAPWPQLLHHEQAHGLLFESWLAGKAPTPDDFDHPELLAGPLAELHRVPLPKSAVHPAARPETALAKLAPLLAHDQKLLALADLEQERPSSETRTWIHGDLHPDQVLLAPGSEPKLIDFDELSIGDPVRDLASWIAGHLAAAPELTWQAASAAWLAAYRQAGGQFIREPHLLRLVRYDLTLRAAACLRRLERDAHSRAQGILACAARIEQERCS